MKDLTKYFIDLSKCSEEQRKSLPQILEKADQEVYFLAKPSLLSGKFDTYYPYLVFSRSSSNVWVFSHNKPDRTELTYPEFIRLFDGGEGEERELLIKFAHYIQGWKNQGLDFDCVEREVDKFLNSNQ